MQYKGPMVHSKKNCILVTEIKIIKKIKKELKMLLLIYFN